MKPSRIALPLLALFLPALLVSIQSAAGARKAPARRFVIESGGPDFFVPKGKIWKISGLSPYQSEKGMGTADLYIEGGLLVGKDRGYSVYGKFDVSINNKQTSPLWVLAEAKVTVGDSRGRLTVEEMVDEGSSDE